MGGQLLGVSVLELRTDQTLLDAGLALAERKADLSGARMQASMDKRMVSMGATTARSGDSMSKNLAAPFAAQAIAAKASATEQTGAAARSSAAYAKQGVAAKASADAQVAADARVAAATRALAAEQAKYSDALAATAARRAAVDTVLPRAGSSTSGGPLVWGLGAGGGRGGGASAGLPPMAHGGGNQRIDIFYHRDPTPPSGGGGSGGGWMAGGGGGGGGGGGVWFLPGMPGRNLPGARQFGWGTGIAGMAGIGSAASFAGLGFEHLLTTLLGVGGSAAGAGIGGGLLGLGSLGKLAVGGGSDAAVMKSTIADTKTLYTSYTQVQTAQSNLTQATANYNKQVALYGKNSKQAQAALSQQRSATNAVTSAQQGLNTTMLQLGPAAGAELALAKKVSGLNTLWDQATAKARVNAVAILSQVVQLGTTFVPKVASAAQQNLAIIDQGIKPLFVWLEGPQGIQVWDDLENKFKSQLPTAIHAFDQGVELLLRVTDLAAQHTGGFVGSLDHLLTRLNAMDNAQLGMVIQRYINDFHLWGTLVKLLADDVYLLFHQDVGTGNALIATLDNALLRLKAYETSAHGSAQLQNIFMVHKTEVLELAHIIGQLGSTFAQVYMAVAPAAVTAMNDVVLPVFKAIGGAISAIAHMSPLAADGLGLLLIATKAFGAGAVFTGLKSLVQTLIGARTAATGAAAAEAAMGAGGVAAGAGAGADTLAAGRAMMGGGAAAGFSTAEGLGVMGLGGTSAGLMSGAALSSAVSLAMPVAIAGAAAYFGSRAIRSVIPGPTTTVSAKGVNQKNTGIFAQGQGVLNIKETGNFAGFSIEKLQALLLAEKRFANKGIKVTLNGVKVPLDQLKQLERAAIKVRQTWNKAFNDAWSTTNRFFLNSKRSLPALEDDYRTVLRNINHDIGLNSNAGLHLWSMAIRKMVSATTTGMLDGKISISRGLHEINTVLAQGLHSGAITWDQDWRDMFSTVTDLYQHHKINTKQYLSELGTLTHNGWNHIRNTVQASLDKQKQDLAAAHADGKLTDAQYHAALHQAQVNANQQQGVDMANWVSQLEAAMKNSGSLTAKGMQMIAGDLNNALGLFGAAKLPIPQAIAWGQWQAAGGKMTTARHGGTFARGGVFQVGRPGEAGRDTVPLSVGGQDIIVGRGEQVVIFNRHQIPEVNARFGDVGGLPGYFASRRRPNYMASGGIVPAFGTGGLGSPGRADTGGDVYPFPAGTTLERVDDGRDASMPVGAPIGPIGPARYGGQRTWGGGAGNQPIMWWQLTSGPRAGAWVYLAEQITPKPWAGILSPTQAVATFAGSGTGIEMGWMADGSGGNTLAQARGHGGQAPSPEGTDFANFIAGLARGIITGGGGASGAPGISWSNLSVPRVKGSGALSDVVRATLKAATKAANAYGMKKAGAASGTGTGGFTALPGGWFRTGATIDNTGGQTGDSNMTFAELLEAGNNAGMRPDLTQLLGEPRGAYGMPMGTAIQIRMPGSTRAFTIRKNDVGSGQPGDPHYTVDLHPGIAGALGWTPNQDVEVKHAALGALLQFSRGGLMDMIAASRGVSYTATASKAKKAKAPKKPAHHKPAKPLATPKLKAPPGFDFNKINALTDLDDQVSGISSWYGVIDGMHGLTGVSPTITNPDGSIVVNPGAGPWPFDPSGYGDAPIGALTGLIDPSTGQVTKGIWDRLREIGLQTDRMNPKAPSLNDTLLGLDETQLETYYGQAFAAAAIDKDFGPWLAMANQRVKIEGSETAWLQKAIDTSTPYGKLGRANFSSLGPMLPPGVHVHGGPAEISIPMQMWGTEIREKAREYKNMLAKIKWLTKRKEQLPIEKRDREAKIAARFLAARHRLANQSLTGSFSGSQLLGDQLDALSGEERAALAPFRHRPVPAFWGGDKASWAAQLASERDQVTSEFDARKQALRDAAAKKNLDGQLSRSNALYSLQVQEAADKTALGDEFDRKSNTIKDGIRGDTSTSSADKKFLSSFLSKVKGSLSTDQTAIGDASGFSDQMKAYIGPLSSLAINIATMRNVTIPGLLQEVGDLTGTRIPDTTSGGTSASDSALLALEQQRNTTLAQENAVLSAQYKVLADWGKLPQFGGTFHGGGVIPGRVGEERMIRALAGETIVPIDGGPGEIHNHINISGRDGYLKDLIDVQVTQSTRRMARNAENSPPGRGGGVRVG